MRRDRDDCRPAIAHRVTELGNEIPLTKAGDFLTLNPGPFVHPGRVATFIGKPRRHIVIGKVGVQCAPGPREHMQT
jgi:hypothetical protein